MRQGDVVVIVVDAGGELAKTIARLTLETFTSIHHLPGT